MVASVRRWRCLIIADPVGGVYLVQGITGGSYLIRAGAVGSTWFSRALSLLFLDPGGTTYMWMYTLWACCCVNGVVLPADGGLGLELINWFANSASANSVWRFFGAKFVFGSSISLFVCVFFGLLLWLSVNGCSLRGNYVWCVLLLVWCVAISVSGFIAWVLDLWVNEVDSFL